MKKGPKKGQYGYRDFSRRIRTAKVAFGGAAILIQLFARNFTDNEAAKNILTVMAVLSVLPTANVAAPLLASWRYKTPSREFFQLVERYRDMGLLLYDLILTSNEQIMPMDAVMIHPSGVLACCLWGKLDARKAEVFLKEAFQAYELKGNVQIVKDEETFIKRLESLKPADQRWDKENAESRAAVLKGLSM